MSQQVFKQLESADIYEAFGELGELIETKVQQQGIETLTRKELEFYCVYWFILLMDKGGYGQYYLHHSADHYETLFEALHAINAPGHAKLLNASKAAYVGEDVPKSFDIRLTELEKNEPEALALFRRLGTEFYNNEEFLIQLLMDYAFSHQNEFAL
ncbi:MAG: hypothetical protein CMF25_08050 [Kangiellaceae bacterium]|nr:hypothetical protein [Kangiellaceae bacterium]|tara:strand:+ start:12274 stop:12741 length:468 start_codon:yes stop_codon:yes gene_type:complete